MTAFADELQYMNFAASTVTIQIYINEDNCNE